MKQIVGTIEVIEIPAAIEVQQVYVGFIVSVGKDEQVWR